MLNSRTRFEIGMAVAFVTAILGGAPADAGQDYTLRFGPSAGAVGGEANITVLLDVADGELPVAAWSIGVCHGPEIDIVSVADGSTTAGLEPDFLDDQGIPGEGWAVGVIISFVGAATIPPGNGYALHVARYSLLTEGTATVQYCDTIGSPPVQTVVSDSTSATFPPSQSPGEIEIGLIPPFSLALAAVSAAAGDPVELPVTVDNPVAFDGFGFGVSAPATDLAIDAIDVGTAVLDATGGLGPDYFVVNLAPAGGDGATVGCLLSLGAPFATVPVGTAQEIVRVQATVAVGAADGTVIPVTFSDALGLPPVLTRFTVAGTGVTPLLTAGQVEVSGGGTGTDFLRGDVNGDGTIDLPDPIALASYLFSGGAEPGCLAAGDVNDDDAIQIDDVVSLLSYQFSGGNPPAPPFPACGADPTPGDIICEAAPVCP